MSEPSVPLPDSRLDFVAAPQLDLDQLLQQLVERAREVLAAQERLRALLAANESLLGDLDLPLVLRRIVEAACTLVDARRGALGVPSPTDDTLGELLTVGLDGAPLAALPPDGGAALGALVVPIRVRDEVFGHLYLTESAKGAFTDDDEELVTAFAATAGLVIDNARLFEESQRRQEWLQASALVTRRMLAAEGEDPLAVIAREARVSADADLVSVVLPAFDEPVMQVEVAAGEHAADLVGHRYPAEGSLVRSAVEQRRPLLVADAARDPHAVHLREVLDVGPVMTVPLLGAERVRGALVVGRRRGRPRFDAADLDMATTFANHAAVALELADARGDQQKMAVLEDRDRIARDLHDHVIQRLFAAGLSVNALARQSPDEQVGERLVRVASELDETIRQIRTSIFQLRGSLGPNLGTMREQVLAVAADMAGPLGVAPTVRFRGPVDAILGAPAVEDVVAVVREALSNTARHAHASHADVEIGVNDGFLTVAVSDDGVGIGDSLRRSGLANLRRRAEQYSGTLVVDRLSVADGTAHGTLLTWAIPLR